MNRFFEPTRFLILWGCVACFAVFGAVAGMDTAKYILKNLTVKAVFHREPKRLVKGEKMDWTGQPPVHQVIQRKGIVLRVRSFIQNGEKVNFFSGKAVTF